MNLQQERDYYKGKYEYSVKQIAALIVDLQNGKLCCNCRHDGDIDHGPCDECGFATHDKWEWRGFDASKTT